jgi:HJR/Mrr/RecB family endonuclease
MIYQSQGYIVKETPKTGDQGADVFIEKAGERSVVQAKLYGHPVGNKAVQEVVAARIYYGCQYAIVVSNNFFTPSAKELARSSNVKLVDQTEFLSMLAAFNKSPKDYARLAILMKPAQVPLVLEVLPADS